MSRVLVALGGEKQWAIENLYGALGVLDYVDFHRTWEGDNKALDLSQYAVTHLSFIGVNRFAGLVNANRTVFTVHHVVPELKERLLNSILVAPPDVLTTGDPWLACEFGTYNLNVTMTPYWVAPATWTPTPSDTFRVGMLGIEQPVKRFDVIREACEIAGVRCVDGTKASMAPLPYSNVDDFFNSIDCYAVAAYIDGGSLPALEAMARGIPVVTTPVGQMPLYLRDGVNGYFTNSVADDVAEKIALVRDGNLPSITPPKLPTSDEWVARHDRIYRRLMEMDQ